MCLFCEDPNTVLCQCVSPVCLTFDLVLTVANVVPESYLSVKYVFVYGSRGVCVCVCPSRLAS